MYSHLSVVETQRSHLLTFVTECIGGVKRIREMTGKNEDHETYL